MKKNNNDMTNDPTLRDRNALNENEAVGARALDRGEVAIPVIEEQVAVNKREVERGGVRVKSSVTETPVEGEVSLREERVRVERRPVDRPATGADVEGFREGTIEVTERAEEPVVSKRARVVEEVVVGKDVRERTQTVRDTVKRTDVEVEDIAKPRRRTT